MVESIIQLCDAEPVARGGHRSCYVHPDDPTLCIKVADHHWKDIPRRKKDPLRFFRRRKNYDENLSEWLELRTLERKLGSSLKDHFPKAHGFVQTDLGEALVVDLISDWNGNPSPTLKKYLWSTGLDKDCEDAIDKFWAFLKKNKILVRDPFPHNLLVVRKQEHGPVNIVQVDGFGASDFLPISRWITSRRNRKLDGRRRRMEKQLRKHLHEIEKGKGPSGKGT